jgi:hypothetical protein
MATQPGPAAATVVTAAPVATPQWPFDEAVARVCLNEPLPDGAVYGGTVHPILIVEGGTAQRANEESFSLDTSRADWLQGEWNAPIQLVLCLQGPTNELVDSCGMYLDPLGDSREVTRYRSVITARVVDAKTAAVRQTVRLVGGEPAACPQQIEGTSIVGASVPFADIRKLALDISAGR